MLQKAIEEYITVLSDRADADSKNTQNTILAYKNDLRQLCQYLEAQEINDWVAVRSEHIQAYLLWMREEQAYRPTTIARKIAALKAFFRYLYTRAILEINPADTLETPRIQKYPPRTLSSEEVDNLFRQVHGDTPTGQRDLAMLHVLYATGMRVSELVALNLRDFQPTQATIVCSGNGRSAHRRRELPLSEVALETLQRYLKEGRPHLLHHTEEQALFLNHRGERLTRQGFWLIVKGYARQASIMNLTPHILRHSFALHMLEGGMELRSVQELLGHAHISTTQVYSQLATVGVSRK